MSVLGGRFQHLLIDALNSAGYADMDSKSIRAFDSVLRFALVNRAKPQVVVFQIILLSFQARAERKFSPSFKGLLPYFGHQAGNYGIVVGIDVVIIRRAGIINVKRLP